jgi:hypothetical protein
MVVNDLDRDGIRLGAVPFEANPPLIVDPNTVLTCALAPQRLEPVAGNYGEHLE